VTRRVRRHSLRGHRPGLRGCFGRCSGRVQLSRSLLTREMRATCHPDSSAGEFVSEFLVRDVVEIAPHALRLPSRRSPSRWSKFDDLLAFVESGSRPYGRVCRSGEIAGSREKREGKRNSNAKIIPSAVIRRRGVLRQGPRDPKQGSQCNYANTSDERYNYDISSGWLVVKILEDRSGSK